MFYRKRERRKTIIKKTNVLATALLAALLMGSFYAVFPVKASARSDVDVLFYGSQAAAYAALVVGSVDFIQWSVTAAQKTAIESNPAITISSYSENGMMEFDLNNNYTVQTYPGVKNPVTDKHFRRALSCMVDKQWIVNSILSGGGVVLNVPIPVNSLSWLPDCALPENHPWQYNMTKATEQLTLAGFVDLEPDGIVNYPDTWPGRPGQPNMDPLIMYVRIEDERLAAGTYFATQLAAFGIPCTTFTDTSIGSYKPVMDDRNYHIYTGGWSLGRYPTFLYCGFHSNFWFEGGSNYVTGMNESNLPNYPDYDELAHDVYYTDSFSACQEAAKEAVALGWCDYVFNIPLWSYNNYVAWRKTMPGVVNMFGYGLGNPYQFLNAYDSLGGSIRMGTIAAPKALNPIYSVWYYDYAVLDRVYEGLMMINPYDLAVDQPGAAQDWEVGTWIDPDPGPGEPSEKTKVTYYLRKDVGIVLPTGAFMRNLDAFDLEFSCWYTYAFDDGWNWANYQDVHHTNVVDDYTIEFYFDDSCFWRYAAP
ncbi:hypothetical protein KAU92_02745, partial [Candidatus Bathyarchaeota archaeon]|nr:hypothetical protein [Candidatus Bathyarchaeota archaeon]